MIPDYDKYEAYIWACYGLTVFVLALVLWWSLSQAASVRRELDSLDGERRRAKVTET